ncbi:MAG TPA: cytochrome P450, partial [Beutenbergiaceae bacterium]|nr:cytochrome P450 [Beutenbergiaceae bacterium]
ADQRAAYDQMRDRCPVTQIDDASMILRHAPVVAAANDPESFSSAVTARRAIPNSLDGEEHAAYRAIVERFLTPERVAGEEDKSRRVATDLVAGLPRGQMVATIATIGTPFAVRSMSAWLGWPAELHQVLIEWMGENHAATRSGDRERMARVAEEFDQLISTQLESRRGATPTDVTGELMQQTVFGRALTHAEIVSILRNWTAGDLGSLATSIGVIVHYLAAHHTVQREVRALVNARRTEETEAALEEILRIDDPFVSNRRRATRAVELAGAQIPAQGRVLLNWTAANRDPLVFGDPDRYDPAGNAGANLVFGVGPHACPARGLSLMQLRVITEELLTGTTWLEPAPDEQAVRQTPPVGGWARVPVVLS